MNYVDDLAMRIGRFAPLNANLPMPLLRGYAALALARGFYVTGSDVHDTWAAYEASVDPSHPLLVPWDQLEADVQALDLPFVQAIHQALTELQAESGDESATR
jgi:hypothetical protein